MSNSDRTLKVAIVVAVLSGLFLLGGVPYGAWELYQIRRVRLELARIAEADARRVRDDLGLPDVFGWRKFCRAELAWNQTAAAAWRRGADRPWSPVILPPEPEYIPTPSPEHP